MVFRSHRIMLSSLVLLFVTGCGGGSDVDPAATSDPGQTHGTVGTSPSTTINGSTSTTAGAVTTTTVSSTTSTTRVAQSDLPPLAASKTKLVKGAGAQTLGTITWADRYNGGTGAPIGNANCEDWNKPRNYFAHAHLSIFKDGERLAIPQYIGWLDNCIYDINTDSRNGVIDALSSSGYKYFTLGEFFRLWEQPLSWDNVAGITGLPIVIYINDNGVLKEYTGNPANIELANHRSITIQIGTRLNEIPTYDWSSYTGGYE